MNLILTENLSDVVIKNLVTDRTAYQPGFFDT